MHYNFGIIIYYYIIDKCFGGTKMNYEEVEESHRIFVAEKRMNNGRIFDIKTQRYEDEN